ncbi:MAG: protease complex subunit PrcB family protein [Elusimicrobia bacterium]|nr:protease complex subunit PrcB family protein [Elusimicrobiota bacterium]
MEVVMEWRRTVCQQKEPAEFVARDESSWRKLWGLVSSEALPEVNFSKQMAVGIFLGIRNTGGYSVEITGVREEGGRLVVLYKEKKPSPEAFVTQALTAPCHLQVVPRSELPLVFRKTS